MFAKFISPDRVCDDMGIYEFSKTVNFERGGNGTVKIFAATRYILYINDTYVCEGPCRSSADIRYYDVIKTDAFKKGENNVRIRVMHITDSETFSSAMKSNYPMLIFSAEAGGEAVTTDTNWECNFIKSVKLVGASEVTNGVMADFVPPFEVINYPEEKLSLGLKEIGYFDFEGKVRDVFGIHKPYHLAERPIPMIYPQQPVLLKVVKQGNGFIEFDAGEYTTAKVEIDFACGTDAKIIYSECYRFGDEKQLRDDTNGELWGPYDKVSTTKEFTYSPYWFRSFRYIRIETKDVNFVKQVRVLRVNYPFDIVGKFNCSNELYNKMWDVSINTLKCCAHEIFVDCPHYEQQQYIMDAAIESAVVMRLTKDTKLIKKCIAEFAASQLPTGMICANTPCSYVQIIPGFSFFFIFLLKDYLEYSADVDFVSQFTGVIDKILVCFENQVKENGYITNSQYWDYQDCALGWELCKPPVEDGKALTIYNLYYACALKDSAFIFNKVGRPLAAQEYTERYEKLKDIINNLCYNKEKGMYRDGSDCDTYCVHTALWAILSNVVPESEYKNAVNTLFDTAITRPSFSMNYYLFRALEKCNKYDSAKEILNDWGVMLDNHCTTWCEQPGQSRSECHGWSCAPVCEFSSNILGVKYNFDDVLVIKPVILGLSYANGSVPTRFGLIDISWKINNNIFVIDVVSPDGITKELTMPDGTVHKFSDNEVKFECQIF